MAIAPGEHAVPDRPSVPADERPAARRASDRFDAARDLLDGLLTSAPIGVALLDADLRYVHVNAAIAALDGLPADEHTGRTPSEVVPTFAAELEPLLREVLERGEPVLNVERPGPGEPIPTRRSWLSSYFPIGGVDGTPAGVAIVAVDVTERRRAEDALRESEARVRRLVESNPIAVFLADDQRITEANDAFLQLLGYTRAELEAGEVRWREITPAAWAAADHRALVELAERGTFTPFEKEYRARDGRTVPILIGGTRLDGTDTSVCFMLDLTERRLADERLAFLADASELLAGSPSPGRTVRRLTRLAVPRLADCAIVDLVQEDGSLEPVAVAHADARRQRAVRAFRRRRPPARTDQHGAGSVVRTGRAELYPEVDPALIGDAPELERLPPPGMRSAIVAPLMARGRTLGALTLVTSSSGRRYGPEDLALAEEVGRRAALAYDNARLLRAARTARAEAEAAARRMAALARLADTALADLGIDDLLQALLERVVEILAADTATILLLDEAHRELVPRASHGVPLEAIRDVRVPVGGGFAGRIAADPRPLHGQSCDADLDELAGTERPRALLGVPLLVDGRVIGVLHVGARTPRAFTEDDARLLHLVGERVALAAEHAHLMARHRGVAETLQRSLLPRSLPSIEGVEIAASYRPATVGDEVGGDWYDVVPGRDGSVLLVIGDAIGHDLVAASAMAELRHALRAYALLDDAPGTLVSRLADLAASLGDDRIATMTVLRLEPGGSLRYVNAGHPPPLHVAADGAVRFLDGSRCPPVGAIGARFVEAESVVEPGDAVVLYTDGLVEERGRPIDEGLARLATAARTAPEPLESLTRHLLTALLGDARTLDDVALLALRRAAR